MERLEMDEEQTLVDENLWKRRDFRVHGLRRYLPRLLLFAVLAFLFWLSPGLISTPTRRADLATIDRFRSSVGYKSRLNEFRSELVRCLQDSVPAAQPLRKGPPQLNGPQIQPGMHQYSLNLTEGELQAMTRAHTQYTSAIQTMSMERLYVPHSQGLVMSASSVHLPMVLTSITILRRTGSLLPVEVFVDSPREYASVCSDDLPRLNARCRWLNETLGSELKITSGFQNKVYAILFSSFENVVFMDSDNLALRDPGRIFAVEPYKSRGMVSVVFLKSLIYAC
jgi:alpha 1,2-mannosyltransferase